MENTKKIMSLGHRTLLVFLILLFLGSMLLFVMMLMGKSLEDNWMIYMIIMVNVGLMIMLATFPIAVMIDAYKRGYYGWGTWILICTLIFYFIGIAIILSIVYVVKGKHNSHFKKGSDEEIEHHEYLKEKARLRAKKEFEAIKK